MEKCVDCDYKFTCGKANSRTICDRYKNTPKKITHLKNNEDGVFEFEMIYEEDC
jgi:hypothetical protein